MKSIIRYKLLILLGLFPWSNAFSADILIDAIVASVDGRPLTLSELESRMNPPRKLTLSEAAVDPEAKYALGQMVNERLIESEARNRNIEVDKDDIDLYLNELARQNKVGREAMEAAMKAQVGEDYQDRIKFEILKSRLVGGILREGVNVTDEEIEQYIASKPEMVAGGKRLRLSQIVISKKRNESSKLIQKVHADLMAGADFAELASSYSDGPEARSGGYLGAMAEGDLSPLILNSVRDLEPGHFSSVVESDMGFHIFRLDEIYSADKKSVQIEVKKLLQQQKLEKRTAQFFNEELVKDHVVETKI